MFGFFARIMSSCRLLAVVAIAGHLWSAATPAEAQHADIQVQRNTEATLTTGQVDLDTYPATLVFPRRVFQRGFGSNFISNNPGFNAGAGTGTLPPGILDLPALANLGFNMPAFYLPQHGPANLAFWDGFGDVHFAPAPAGHTLTVDGPVPNPDPTTIGVVDGGATNVLGYAFDRTDANGALHRHQTFSLEASGSPAEGIYL